MTYMYTKSLRYCTHLIWAVKQLTVVRRFLGPFFESRLLTPPTGTVNIGCFPSLAPIREEQEYDLLLHNSFNKSTEDIRFIKAIFMGIGWFCCCKYDGISWKYCQTHQQHENLIGNKVNNNDWLGLQHRTS